MARARSTVFSVVLLLSSAAAAQTVVYTWVDKDGLEHFTDDLGAVPRGVKVRTTTGDTVSRLSAEKLPPRPEPTQSAATAGPAAPGHSPEDAWRALFKDTRNRVKDLEEDVESARKRVEEINGMPITARVHCRGGQVGHGVGVPGHGGYRTPCWNSGDHDRLKTKLDRDRRLLLRAREELADLERRAAFEAVPLEWRR